MGDFVRFVSRSDLERARLIREARAIYESVFSTEEVGGLTGLRRRRVAKRPTTWPRAVPKKPSKNARKTHSFAPPHGGAGG